MTTKVVTGRVRLSYVHLFEKFAVNDGDDEKYSTMILIPKSDTKTMSALRAAEKAAAEAGKASKFGGKIPSNLASIIRDGDEFAEDYPERGGHWFMTVSNARQKPGVVDEDVNPILDQSEVYSGCYARVSLNAFPYNTKGNKGVSFGLNHVQKLGDGEPLGGFTRAEDDFAPVSGDEDLIG